MLTCQYDPDFHLDEVDTNREVLAVKQWYETNRPSKVSFRSAENNDETSSIEVKPDWDQTSARANKREKTVETNLYVKGIINFVVPDNKLKYDETGDDRYMRSLTRLIIKTKLRNGTVDGFLMTIMPSVEYLELTNFRAFEKINYIGRDKQFTGRILYHNLEGEFVNGWVYKNGKITHSIKKSQPDEDPIISLKSSGSSDCYEVEYWGWTTTCTDWYQTTNYDPTPVYLYTTCTDLNYSLLGYGVECSPNDGGDGENGGTVDGEDGGYSGGGSGGGSYNPPPEIHTKLKPLVNSISMTYSQRSKLNTALQSFIDEGCMQEALYEELVDRNVKLNFRMYSNPNENSAPATYNPDDSSLIFSRIDNITAENLKEELFHAFQDAYYTGGIEQYGKDSIGNKLPGYVNVEFEAKVFKDISRNLDYGCCYIFDGMHIPIETRIAYFNWIESIQSNPALITEEYDEWLDLFNLYHPEYSSSKHDDLPLSSALNTLLGMSDCF